MEVSKRKANGVSPTNGHAHKKKKKTIDTEQDLEIAYFESEINYHSTVTKMKVGIDLFGQNKLTYILDFYVELILVNALLNEVTLKNNQRTVIDQFIKKITDEIKSIPQGKIRRLSKMSEWLEKFDIKIPLSFSKMSKSFQFIPPTIIETIGSYTYDGLIVRSSNKISTLVDLLVEMPRICIHKKDYLNNEYIEKRAIYLCYLAKILKYSLEFSHLNDTTLNQVVLLVRPNETSSFAIRILLAPEKDYFSEKRLLPTSSNLRWNWFTGNKEENEPFYSTPNYNASVLFDCRYRSTSEYLTELFLSSNELCNGLKLFKIWLEQRQLSHGFGSFEGAMPAFLLAFLLHTKKINKQMNSYQVFRILLVALMENDFSSSQCCSLTHEKITEDLFIEDECVLLDHSGLLNVFNSLLRASYNRLKQEARISLNSFNDPAIDHFQTLFITSMEPIYSMDAIIQISSLDQHDKLLDQKSNKNQLIMDNLNNKHLLLSREVLKLLEYGLKERINLLCPLPAFRQTIKSEKFHSTSTHKQNEEYIELLNEKLNQWRIKTIEQINNIIKQKSEEIKQLHDEYYQEIDKQYSAVNEQIEKKNFSSDLKDQIEYLYIYSQLNSIEKRIRLNTNLFTINQFNEKLRVKFAHYRQLTTETTIVPLRQLFEDKVQSNRKECLPTSSSKNQSNEIIPNQDQPKKVWTLKPITISSAEIPSSPKDQHKISDKNENSTRLYKLKREPSTPVLVDKNRDLYNSKIRLTEYIIDSLPLSQTKPQSVPIIIQDDNLTLVQSYKRLTANENKQQNSVEQNAQLHINSKGLLFSLKIFNQTNYSTLMFAQCEMKNNCLASSTKRNELIIYNSKMNILIILKHQEKKRPYERVYVQWPLHLSSNLSDITYCDMSDRYFIATNNNNHLYSFNSNLLSINDLGCLSNDLQLNYIHCYHETVYVVLGNHNLAEYHFDERNFKIVKKRNIDLFNGNDILLDITCDKNSLIVLYKNRNNEIYLRSIDRRTLDIQLEFLLENKQDTERKSLRIESTRYNGNFIYVNSSQKCLKTIDLTRSDSGKITTIMKQNKSPTNTCLLKDDRLVILHEEPYFLTVHKRLKSN
ncbi:unnamed protein product [Rotaria magnacalcarata]